MFAKRDTGGALSDYGASYAFKPLSILRWNVHYLQSAIAAAEQAIPQDADPDEVLKLAYKAAMCSVINEETQLEAAEPLASGTGFALGDPTGGFNRGNAPHTACCGAAPYICARFA